MNDVTERTLILLPAFDEEGSMESLLAEIRRHMPTADVLVVNDGSLDRTAQVARAHGALVLDLPCNLGVGGAVQAGFRYAVENGYRQVVRCDGDGQHPPEEIPALLTALQADGVDMVIGSRFLGDECYKNTWVRHLGIRGLGWMLSAICRKRVTDPTSGFQAIGRPLLDFFAATYPAEYPEPEALALMRRQGYDFEEAPVRFRERTAGRSTIHGWGTFYYLVKVFLALVVDRARPVDTRFAREFMLVQS